MYIIWTYHIHIYIYIYIYTYIYTQIYMYICSQKRKTMCPPGYYKPLTLKVRNNREGTLSVVLTTYIYIYFIYIKYRNIYYGSIWYAT